jgi:hypothetical protein
MVGLSLGGLGTVANRDLTGIALGGLAVVANGHLKAIAVGGLGVIGNNGITGLAVGGLGVVSTGAPFRGLGISLGAVESFEGVYGVAIAGFRVRAKLNDLRGVMISGITNRSAGLTGVAIGAYNDIRGSQRGLTIGLYNNADELHGVQLGLLNRAGNNRGIFRLLPLINLNLN